MMCCELYINMVQYNCYIKYPFYNKTINIGGMRHMDTKIKPSQIDITARLCGSGFGKAEFERIAMNIISIAINKKGDEWFSFTIEDYKSLCDHSVDELEEDMIYLMKTRGFLTCDKNHNFSICPEFIRACFD